MQIIRCPSVSVASQAIEPLLHEHWQEVADQKTYPVIRPDYEKYQYLNDAGNLIILLALEERMDPFTCIGYSVNLLTPHLHYTDKKLCCNDVLFVRKAERYTTTTGARLIARTKQEAVKENCAVMQWHAKPNSDLFNVLNKRLPVFEYAFAESL